MPRPRKQRPPNLREELAAALLRILELEGQPIDRETAKRMTSRAVRALFEIDHYPIARANGGSNHPSNLLHRLKAPHREKTAKIDVPQIAKGKRLAATNDRHIQKMRSKILGTPSPSEAPSRWPQGRKLNTKGAKIQSRPFPKRDRA